MARYEPGGIGTETVLYRGITTSDGNVGGTTLIVSDLIGSNDFLTDTIIIIMSGDCRRETRDISSFIAASGTITVGTAFSAQIVSGITIAVIARMSADVEIADLQADVGDASSSTLGSLYGILGNPAATLTATIDLIRGDTITIEDGSLAANPTSGSLSRFIASGGTSLGTQLPSSKSLYDVLALDRWDVRLSAARAVYLDSILDTTFHDNFDDESLSTTLWNAAVVTGSTTVTESATAPDTLRIQNAGAGTTGEGTLSSIQTFERNVSIRAKIELFRGSLAADGERCNANLGLYKDVNDYIYFGPYRDTSEALNNRAYVFSNVNGGGEVVTAVGLGISDGIAREYRIDVTAENIYFYVDDILVHSLKDTTLTTYQVELYAATQNNTDIIDVRFDYCKVNKFSDDLIEIYKKLLQIQGGTDSIGTVVNSLDNALDLNYIRGSTTADGTEQTIYANTSTRPFIFTNIDISLVNMAAGDTTIIRKYKMIDGTNYRLIEQTTYTNAQTLTGITVKGNEGAVAGIKITLQQTTGTNRAYPWIYFDEAA